MDTAILNENPVRARTPNDSLSALWPSIAESRIAYLDVLEDLPGPFNEIAKTHFHSRIAKYDRQPLLGELLPWLAVDVLKIKKDEVFQEIIAGWLYLYFSVMLLDDIIDSGEMRSAPENLILVSLLQQRGICLLFSHSNNNGTLSNIICEAFTKTASAAFEELDQHRGRVNNFDPGSIRRLGDKLALAKICLEVISSRLQFDKSWLFSAFEELVTGLQLLDDLTDWQEDYESQSYTLPLTLAFNGAGSINFIDNTNDKWGVFILLLKTGGLEKTLEIALQHLEIASAKLRENERGTDSHLADYIRQLLHEGLRIKRSLTGFRFYLRKYEVEEVRNDPELKRHVQEMRRGLTILANSS